MAAAVWTACTKPENRRSVRPRSESFAPGSFFGRYLPVTKCLCFPQKNSKSGKVSSLKNGQFRTTIHHTSHHKLTTKNHRLSLTFPENSLKNHKTPVGDNFCVPRYKFGRVGWLESGGRTYGVISAGVFEAWGDGAGGTDAALGRRCGAGW